MYCPRCGHENPDDAQFCGECGAAQREERREPGPYRPLDSVEGSGDIPERDLGQLIDATFKAYGKAIIPFFAIALIPQIPSLLSLAVGGPADDAAQPDISLTETILALASLLIGIVAEGREPQGDRVLIIVTTDEVADRNIREVKGIVMANSVRAKHLGRDIMAGFRNLAGGEITEYTKLMAESREVAMQRMSERAEAMGADAIVGTRFITAGIAQGASEILAYGTAVKLE